MEEDDTIWDLTPSQEAALQNAMNVDTSKPTPSVPNPPPKSIKGPSERSDGIMNLKDAKETKDWMSSSFKCIVASKGTLRPYKNRGGSGHFFSAELQDNSAKMQITFFNDEAWKFHEFLKTGNVYHIKKVKIQPTNKEFNLFEHPYELSCKRQTTIAIAVDLTGVPRLDMHYRNLSDCIKAEVGTMTNVLAVVHAVGETDLLEIEKTVYKTNLYLMDQSSDFAMCFSIFGDRYLDKEIVKGTVILVRNVLIIYDSGRKVQNTNTTEILIDPKVKGSEELSEWYATSAHDPFDKNKTPNSL